MPTIRFLPIFSALALALCGPALADEAKIAAGKQLAIQECSGCHRIDGAPAPTRGGAPGFADIAKMPSATMLSIRVFLRSSHRNKTMPNIILSDKDIDVLANYILSLKK